MTQKVYKKRVCICSVNKVRYIEYSLTWKSKAWNPESWILFCFISHSILKICTGTHTHTHTHTHTYIWKKLELIDSTLKTTTVFWNAFSPFFSFIFYFSWYIYIWYIWYIWYIYIYIYVHVCVCVCVCVQQGWSLSFKYVSLNNKDFVRILLRPFQVSWQVFCF